MTSPTELIQESELQVVVLLKSVYKGFSIKEGYTLH